MDLECNMEFSFPETNHLNDFSGGNSGISDKLDLGTGQLLDSVPGTNPCVHHHDSSDKHLSASDFNLDLGPANDLVSSSDFPLPVSDITGDVMEECSEGYSIFNAALEGGGILPKQSIPPANTLNLGNVTNIQSIQLNQEALSGMSAIQVIPIQNMQLLSTIKPLGNVQNVQSINTNRMKDGNCMNPLIQSNTPAAVLLGNVLLLQTLPNQLNHPSVTYQQCPTLAPVNLPGQNQILQVLNVQGSTLPASVKQASPSQMSYIRERSKEGSHVIIEKNDMKSSAKKESSDHGVTIRSLLQKSQRQTHSHFNKSSKFRNTPRAQGTEKIKQDTSKNVSERVVCENVMSLAPQTFNGSTEIDRQTETSLCEKSDSDNQKNTKILVYGKNIALTFDCRNQSFVMNSIAKAMKQSVPTTAEASDSVKSTDKYSKFAQKKSESQEPENGRETMKSMKYVSLLNSSPKKARCDSEGIELCRTIGDEETDCSVQHRSSTSQFSKGSMQAQVHSSGNTTENIKSIAETSSSPNKERINSLNSQKIKEIFNIEKQNCSTPEINKSTILTGMPTEKTAMVSILDDDEEKIYKCDLCSAAFSRMGNYTRHRMIHTVNTQDNYRYKCTECGRLFLQRCDMKRHMLIHSKKEPHRCTVCDKGYIRKSDLVVHMRFHSKERAYKCQHCSKQFFQSGDLNRHVRNVHLLSPLLKCGHCNRQFAKESTLIRHMQTSHKDIIIKSLKEKADKNNFVKASMFSSDKEAETEERRETKNEQEDKSGP